MSLLREFSTIQRGTLTELFSSLEFLNERESWHELNPKIVITELDGHVGFKAEIETDSVEDEEVIDE